VYTNTDSTTARLIPYQNRIASRKYAGFSVPDGYVFKGWDTDKNAANGNPIYNPGYEVGKGIPDYYTSATSPLKLYAIWGELPSYTIKYHANYPDGETEPDFLPFKTVNGAYAKIKGTELFDASGFNHLPDEETYRFVCWNTAADGSGTVYNPGATRKFPDNSEENHLYAIWESINTVTYYANHNNDGTGGLSRQEHSLTALSKDTFDPPPNQPRVFVEWNTHGYWTESGGTGSQVINASGVFVADVANYTGANGVWTRAQNTTLYAKWIPYIKVHAKYNYDWVYCYAINGGSDTRHVQMGTENGWKSAKLEGVSSASIIFYTGNQNSFGNQTLGDHNVSRSSPGEYWYIGAAGGNNWYWTVPWGRIYFDLRSTPAGSPGYYDAYPSSGDVYAEAQNYESTSQNGWQQMSGGNVYYYDLPVWSYKIWFSRSASDRIHRTEPEVIGETYNRIAPSSWHSWDNDVTNYWWVTHNSNYSP